MTRAIALALLVVAGCGKPAAKDACAVACDHVIELALGKAEVGEAAKASAEQRGRCVAACRAGKMEPRCVIASKTLEQAMSCTARAMDPSAP